MPPKTLIAPRSPFSLQHCREILPYRDLLYFLSLRDVKVRYKQTLLGILWAVLQPFIVMVVFSLFFGRLGGMNKTLPGGLPPKYYPIFTYAALLPWQLFAKGLQDTASSLVGNASLVTKVYFPRLILPLSSILSGLVDFFFSFLVFLGLLLYFHIPITWHFLLLPIFVFLAGLTAFSVGTFFSALNVKYRDIQYAMPFLVQLWLFVSPVVYGTSILPEKFRFLYALNPLVGVIEGFRFCIFPKLSFAPSIVIPSLATILGSLLLSVGYFFRVEGEMADLI